MHGGFSQVFHFILPVGLFERIFFFKDFDILSLFPVVACSSNESLVETADASVKLFKQNGRSSVQVKKSDLFLLLFF